MGECMGDCVFFVVVEDKGKFVVGVFNFIGGDILYGWNWGCVEYVYYNLFYFEVCYY